MSASEINADRGYQEVEHTADWEIRVWASNLTGLFIQAAIGMYALQGAELKDKPRIKRSFDISGIDDETLLVNFLDELLFLTETERVAFTDFEIKIKDGNLHATVRGAPLEKIAKDIKAVTYHRLSIETTPHGLEAGIVFDV